MLVVLTLAQALVFNRIHFLGYAMPLLLVYFAIVIPRGYPRWATLLWCFTLGLAVDLFSDTPGAAAGAMTFVALLQPYVLELFIPREAPANMEISIKQMGSTATFLILVYCLTFFSLEMFSFANWLTWGLYVVGSTLLTLMLVLAFESVRR